MNKVYPCYRVSAPWTKQEFHYFPKDRNGLEQAIEFANQHGRHFVTYHSSPQAYAEIVWESES